MQDLNNNNSDTLRRLKKIVLVIRMKKTHVKQYLSSMFNLTTSFQLTIYTSARKHTKEMEYHVNLNNVYV